MVRDPSVAYDYYGLTLYCHADYKNGKLFRLCLSTRELRPSKAGSEVHGKVISPQTIRSLLLPTFLEGQIFPKVCCAIHSKNNVEFYLVFVWERTMFKKEQLGGYTVLFVPAISADGFEEKQNRACYKSCAGQDPDKTYAERTKNGGPHQNRHTPRWHCWR